MEYDPRTASHDGRLPKKQSEVKGLSKSSEKEQKWGTFPSPVDWGAVRGTMESEQTALSALGSGRRKQARLLPLALHQSFSQGIQGSPRAGPGARRELSPLCPQGRHHLSRVGSTPSQNPSMGPWGPKAESGERRRGSDS